MTKLTPKQEAFCLAYLETSNAAEAYRRSYKADRMSAHAVEVEASRLLAHPEVSLRVAGLQKSAASEAVLDRAWVLERLMRNARIAMGEEKVKVTIKPRGADQTVDLEVTMRDAAAANKALELLGKTDEVRLIVDRHELTGKDGEPIQINSTDEFISRISRLAARGKANGSAARNN